MKLILSLLGIIMCMQATAQTQDLQTLADGEFLGMNALFDEKENLFGYISMYDYGKSGNKTKKFEYVVLDKNLNPIANKTFDGDITAGDYYGYINFDGKIVLYPNRVDASLVKPSEMFTPTSMIIDLKDNTIKRKVFYDYDHGKFKEMVQNETWNQNRKEQRAEKKENGFNYISYANEIKEGGFLVHEYEDHDKYTTENHLMRYDENKKQLWWYEYNKNSSKSNFEVLRLIEKDEHYYYGILLKKIKREDPIFFLVVIDMKTGKEVHKKQIEGPWRVLNALSSFPTFSYGRLNNDKTFDDKIVIVGQENSIYGLVNGITRLVINKKTFDTELKILSYDKDFRPFVPKIKGTGMVEKGYVLDPRDIFFHKDGSVGILFEKYKPASQYTAQKTTDMVYVYTDKDFKITGSKIFEKEKSRWQNADYLFSQNLNNGNDLVFFYRDYQKDSETKARNWNLFINTLIDGKFKQEMIPISAKENYIIFPYIAKEGYILLQELNTKAKYNQIRLERLNY